MNIEIEISAGGILRAKSPHLPVGSTITLPTAEKEITEPVIGDGSWEFIRKALHEVKDLDIPRRSHDEILHDLHTFRESR